MCSTREDPGSFKWCCEVLGVDPQVVRMQAVSAISVPKHNPKKNGFDPVYFEDAHYLAPDEGGDKAYRLLADAMEKSGRVALAEMVSRGKEKLVLIRSSKGGLILQSMFYANEIRDFNEIPKGEASRLTPAEFELANGLVEKLSSENFEPEAYEDEYQNRVRAMLDEKVQGREITILPPAPRPAHVIDLMAALKESMKTVQRGKKRTDQRKRRKA
jgi:DNA end-binding protein Ku